MNDGVMTQEELDALLQEHATSQTKSSSDLDIDNYLTPLEQDALAEIGNISMGSAATALSTIVNRKVQITVPTVFMSTPGEITKTYPEPCIVVKIGYQEGLEGDNLLVIHEHDALVIGNLMMGEDGTNLPPELDELYLSAVTEAMNMMMGSASTAMSELFRRAIDISPPETTRRDLAHETLVDENLVDEERIVSISFRMEIEDLVDSTLLQIVKIDFAKDMVASLMPPEPEVQQEPEVSSAHTEWSDLKKQPVQTEVPQTPSVPERVVEPGYDLGNINIDLIRDIPVQVRAILGRTRMAIDNILRLGPGHIMELDSLHGEPIELLANERLIARGEVVVVGEQFGVRITEIATPQDRIGSIR
ncbi:MAG: flagellar motor switch phosphatase FliY [Firmicutes bacterium]|nr:flagellar motor switch phosphatase FliY [Bacillota bacterium]